MVNDMNKTGSMTSDAHPYTPRITEITLPAWTSPTTLYSTDRKNNWSFVSILHMHLHIKFLEHMNTSCFASLSNKKIETKLIRRWNMTSPLYVRMQSDDLRHESCCSPSSEAAASKSVHEMTLFCADTRASPCAVWVFRVWAPKWYNAYHNYENPGTVLQT
jgi:hypothetical protein